MLLFLFLVVAVFALVPICIYNSCVKKSYMQKLVKQGFNSQSAKRIAIHYTEKVSRKFYARHGLVMLGLSGVFFISELVIKIENISILTTICFGVACVSLGTFLVLELVEIVKMKAVGKQRKKWREQHKK